MKIKEKYINLFTDFGFKRVFGEEANKDILIDFLNQVLPKNHIIEDLNFSKNDHLGAGEENRKAIFDLYCISKTGERFIVELQKARQDFFKDRSVYYASFPIQEMAQRGKEWNFELQPVFTVGILNFTFKEHQAEKNKIRHHVQLKDQDCQVFYDKLHFIYLELPKFTKSLQECKSRYDKWLWIFKNLPELEEIPVDLREDIFIKLFQITEVAKFDDNERAAYQSSLKYLWDLNNVINTAKKEGLMEGRAEGLAEGAAMEKLKTLLRILAKFPKLSTEELAAISGIEEVLVKRFIAVLNSKDNDKIATFIQEKFSFNIHSRKAKEQKEINTLLTNVLAALK